MTDRLQGKLLVASPALIDPNFARAVVFLTEHNEEGAMGVVLNRPVETAAIAEFLPEWADLAPHPDCIFVGGPVQREVAIGVAQRSAPKGEEQWHPVVSGIGLLDLGRHPNQYRGTTSVRVFSGYSGWIGGQLEAELASGSWFVVDPAVDDIFTSDPDTLWRRVLRRQGGRLALFADFPDDPSLN